MQCVRFVTTGSASGNNVWNVSSCVSKSSEMEAASKLLHSICDVSGPLMRRCNPSSNPSLWYPATCWLLIGVLGKMYDVDRTHSQSATLQFSGLRDLKSSNCPTVPLLA